MPGALEGRQERFALEADIDMSALRHRIVRITTTGAYTMTFAGSHGDPANFGILQDDPSSQENGSVAIFGASKVSVGSTVAAGQGWTTQASGLAAPSGSGSHVMGLVLVGADPGELADVWIAPNHSIRPV